MRLLSVGEVLWDVFGEKEFLGGAPLNFSASAQRLGNTVALLTAVGDDGRGSRAAVAMRNLELNMGLIQTVPDHATGAAIVTTDAAGNATFVIERPAAFDFVDLNESVLAAIQRLRPQWIYFGTLAQTTEAAERRLHRVLAANPDARCFYDINLREGHWNLPLVQRLSRLASIIKLNEHEAETLYDSARSTEPFSLAAFCRFWSSTHGGQTICVTMGVEGCVVWRDGKIQAFAGFPVKVVDTVGAGDVFAAAFLHGHEQGWPLEQTARFANGLGAIVVGRAGATPPWTVEECFQLLAPAS